MGNHLIPQEQPKNPAVDENPLKDTRLPIIFVLGGPGAGKGEFHPVGQTVSGETIYSSYWLPHAAQCERVARKYDFLHISVGDLLREQAEKSTDRGMMIDKLMAYGKPVPTDIVLNLIKEKMTSALSIASGFILDGFPRDKSQAKQFEKEIRPPNLVIYLKASEHFLKDCLQGRAVTSGRKYENEETIQRRIKSFIRKNGRILKRYDGILSVIDAEGDADAVFSEVSAIIDKNLETSTTLCKIE